MTKFELVEKIVNNEFDGAIHGMTMQQTVDFLISRHKYLFDRYYYSSPSYEDSEEYCALYSCITGVLHDLQTSL